MAESNWLVNYFTPVSINIWEIIPIRTVHEIINAYLKTDGESMQNLIFCTENVSFADSTRQKWCQSRDFDC